MPRGDGTGPMGQSQGRGLGSGNRPGEGAGGFCVCPNCGEKNPHQRGVPCNSSKCPECGTAMVRG